MQLKVLHNMNSKVGKDSSKKISGRIIINRHKKLWLMSSRNQHQERGGWGREGEEG